MRFGEIDVTLREAVFSVTIASAMVMVGFLISTQIEHKVNQNNLKYRQAARISDNPEEFATALATDVGNAFIKGHFAAVDTVTHAKLGGEWMSIYADFQKYTKHTRVVHYTTTDGKGHTRHRTRTETYWSWDTYSTERLNSRTVDYMGTKFPFGRFDYSYIRKYGKTVDDGYHKRIEFSCLPKEFEATAFTELRNGSVSSGTLLYKNLPIEKLYESCIASIAVDVFWWLWGVLTAVAVVAFVAAENGWIEDSRG